MIFVTVGVQLPFDRLVRAVDTWAEGQERQVFAQIGVTNFQPKHMTFERFLEPEKFSEICRQSELIIGHAGMGSILTALEHGKPLLVVPRRAALGEHRNDHQLSTVERFRSLANVHVAIDEIELVDMLDDLDSFQSMAGAKEAATTSPQLIATLRDFVTHK
jgi:UDP-N-acetylglucosamine transferase subunit ALG13